MINSSNLFMKRKYRVVIGKEIVDKNKKIDEQNCKNKGLVFLVLMMKRRNYACSQVSTYYLANNISILFIYF